MSLSEYAQILREAGLTSTTATGSGDAGSGGGAASSSSSGGESIRVEHVITFGFDRSARKCADAALEIGRQLAYSALVVGIGISSYLAMVVELATYDTQG